MKGALLYVVFAYAVALASGALTAFPTNTIGTIYGSYPLQFTGQTFSSQYRLDLYLNPSSEQKIPCAVNVSNSAQLLCNLNQETLAPLTGPFKINLVDNATSAILWTDSTNYNEIDSIKSDNFQFWPVSAPLNTPTLITVNVTGDDTVEYKLLRDGSVNYRCVWQYTTKQAIWNVPNVGGLFSVFHPISDNIGTCMSPVLGTITTNPGHSQKPDGPISTLFYLIGDDGYSSERCQYASGAYPNCDTSGNNPFDTFVFTPEVISMGVASGNPRNDYYSPSVSPNVISQAGSTITITGTGFRPKATASYSVNYWDYNYQSYSKFAGIGASSFTCTYVSPTTITCPGPQFTTSSYNGQVLKAQVLLYAARQDFDFGVYRIGIANLTFIGSTWTGFGPLSSGQIIAAKLGNLKVYGTFNPNLPQSCNWQSGRYSPYSNFNLFTNATVVSSNVTNGVAGTILCPVPDLSAYKVSYGDEVYMGVFENGQEVNDLADKPDLIYSRQGTTSAATSTFSVYSSVVVTFVLFTIFGF